MNGLDPVYTCEFDKSLHHCFISICHNLEKISCAIWMMSILLIELDQHEEHNEEENLFHRTSRLIHTLCINL